MQQKPSGSLSPTVTIEQQVDGNQGQIIGQITGGQAISVREGGFFVTGNVIYQNSQLDVTPSLSPRRELPSLLPYLPNRVDQEFELGQAFQTFLKQNPLHPLVCIIHGDESQSHDKFLERLQKLTLPRLLKLDPRQTKIKEYPLNWSPGSKSLDDLTGRFCKSLADTVLGYSFASLEEINKTFCKYPDPVIVHIHLLTEDWQNGPDVLNQLLEFWQNWPPLILGQQLIICIFIKYQIKRSQKKGFSLNMLFTSLRTFFKRNRYRRLNTLIYKQVEAVRAFNGSQFDRLSLIVLPPLSSISRTHVENWARSEETKQFIGEAMVGKLMDEIGDMFETWEEQTASNIIPMDDLADHLMRLLNSLVIGAVQ